MNLSDQPEFLCGPVKYDVLLLNSNNPPVVNFSAPVCFSDTSVETSAI